MIVGKYLSRINSSNKIIKLIYKKLGHLDLHTQLRTRPLMKYVKKNIGLFIGRNIVEVGCGSGNNCFEIYFMVPEANIIGFDLSDELINIAKKHAEELNISEKISFKVADATKYNFASSKKIDYLLLIDFLEHIVEPDIFLSSIKGNLSEESEIIVSVPTYNYKKVFGKNFHKKVGHVRDGFTIEELNVMFNKIGFECKIHSYNTGILGGFGCFLFYRFIFKNKYIEFLKKIILYPFSKIDFINGKYISSSLFAVFKKINKVPKIV